METAQTVGITRGETSAVSPPGDPCIMVIFGASGDLTKRLLMPALYNLVCDGLLPAQFAVVGIAMDDLTTESFREHMSRDIRSFHTRKEFDASAWDSLCSRLYYTPGKFGDEAAFARLFELVGRLDAQHQARGNTLFYMATPPSVFGLISTNLDKAGFKKRKGWKRIIVEKPFGTDLPSAQELNRQILGFWDESQVYRVDHYLGKETVLEPPASFAADDIRNEKAKVMKAVRLYSPEEVLKNTVRGQYGPGKKADGKACPAYRQEPDVNPASKTETFAALRLFIDNARWEGVPIYLRSGKALWKRGTEVVVQFKRAPEALFKGTAVEKLSSNRLIFHIQPDQVIESIFQAKIPGPVMQLQPVNMRFSYGEAFRASRGTGYEVMIYSCAIGDPTLFSRTDLVETAWRIAQPILDGWAAHTPAEFPNYAAGTWGPKAAYDLIERDGRRWFEAINREALERVPLFRGGDPLFLSQVSMALQPEATAPGETIIKEGETGSEMYLICRGEVEVVDKSGKVVATLREGDCFGEVALLLSEPRTATVRAKSQWDLFILDKTDFSRILRDHQQFAEAIKEIAHERYNKAVPTHQLMSGAKPETPAQ